MQSDAKISLEKCRELIPNHAEYTDEQILEIRDSLYELADLAFDVYQYRKSKGDLKGSIEVQK
jgi:hypothetical protein